MRSEDKHRAFMELLDPELSAVMEAAVEDRLNRECTDPLTQMNICSGLPHVAVYS